MRRVPGRGERKAAKPGWQRWTLRVLLWLLAAVAAFHVLCALGLVALKWINPWTTAVQTQRRMESFFSKGRYQKQYTFVPLGRISRDLQHAVIAAEDGRFYEHHGIDWKQLRIVVDEGIESGEVPRGASTITQQLIKNLYQTTSRTVDRKGYEFSQVPLTQHNLGKDRIL